MTTRGRSARDGGGLVFDFVVAGDAEELDFDGLQVEDALDAAQDGVVDLSFSLEFDQLRSLPIEQVALSLPIEGG